MEMAKIFDIVECPTCKGEKQVYAGQIIYNARVCNSYKTCPDCMGFGRKGVLRTSEKVD